jgi:hypothetical protein
MPPHATIFRPYIVETKPTGVVKYFQNAMRLSFVEWPKG